MHNALLVGRFQCFANVLGDGESLVNGNPTTLDSRS